MDNKGWDEMTDEEKLKLAKLTQAILKPMSKKEEEEMRRYMMPIMKQVY